MAGQVCMTAPTCVASHMEVEDSAVVTFCRRRADVFARILNWARGLGSADKTRTSGVAHKRPCALWVVRTGYNSSVRPV